MRGTPLGSRPLAIASPWLAAVVLLAGCGGAETVTTTVGSVAEAPPVQRHLPARPPMRHCDPNITAGQHTSCGFAESTFVAFVDALQANPDRHSYATTAKSPATGRSYAMSCRASGASVTCSGAAGARVHFPLHAAVIYRPAPTVAPAPRAEAKAPIEKTASGGTGEDEIGSASHATDAKFCAEHECIGSFTTEEGTIVRCSDGTYSHAGGISGACSDHGGEA
jgi:hypothetical protein